MDDELIPAGLPDLSDPRAAVQALLSRLLDASADPEVSARDGLAFAVHEHAKQLRAADPAAVAPRMIQAAEMLAAGAKALTDAVNAAKEVLDEEMTVWGADELTGRIEEEDPATGQRKARPVYVTGADGTRYRLSRGHTVTKMFDDTLIIRLIATAARADYQPPAGTPVFLAAQLGDAYQSGVADGAAHARAAIGSAGAWLTTVLEPLANRLAHAGDLTGAGLLKAAVRDPKVVRKQAARFEPVKIRD